MNCPAACLLSAPAFTISVFLLPPVFTSVKAFALPLAVLVKRVERRELSILLSLWIDMVRLLPSFDCPSSSAGHTSMKILDSLSSC